MWKCIRNEFIPECFFLVLCFSEGNICIFLCITQSFSVLECNIKWWEPEKIKEKEEEKVGLYLKILNSLQLTVNFMSLFTSASISHMQMR